MRTEGEGSVHRPRTEASGDSHHAHRGGSGLQKYEKILDKQDYGPNSPLATVGKAHGGHGKSGGLGPLRWGVASSLGLGGPSSSCHP